MRNKLQHRSQRGPQRRQRNLQRVQAYQPKNPNCDRVLDLRDQPILQGATGQTKMLAKIHAFYNLFPRYLRVFLCELRALRLTAKAAKDSQSAQRPASELVPAKSIGVFPC